MTASDGGAEVGVSQVEAAVEGWEAAWNEEDAARRSALLEQATTETCEYTGPTGTVRGRAAIHAAISEAREFMPGAVVVRDGPVYHDGDGWRFAWVVRTAAGEPVLAGVDTVEVDGGRLARVCVLPSA